MKKILALLAAGMVPAMMFALPYTMKGNSGWKKTADDAAKIEYKGAKTWPALEFKFGEAVKPNTFYRITFEAKSTGAPEPIQFYYRSSIKDLDRDFRPSFYPTPEFKKYTIYMYSGEKAMIANPKFVFNPTKEFTLEVKNIKFDAMTDEMLYGENLLACGDFEEENFFSPYSKNMAHHVKVVESPNFLSGEKSLLLNASKGVKPEIISVSVPAVPGKEIEVKFYAKSEKPAKAYVILDFGGSGTVPGSKHYYQTYNFKVENEWKEFSLKHKVTEDFKNYGSALSHLTAFRLGGSALSKGNNAKIYVDGITYTLIK